MFSFRKIQILLFVFCGIVLLAILGGIFLYCTISYKTLTFSSPEVVIIPKGSSLNHIATILHSEGIIERTSDFVLLARLENLSTNLKAGRYNFSPGLTLRQLLRMLVEGDTYEETITIPEGLNRFEIARLLHKKANMDSSIILRLTENDSFCQTLGVEAATLEGYLFPDSYKLEWDVNEATFIRRMVSQLQSQLRPVDLERARGLGFSFYEVVILASLIEEETGAAQERPIISGVFHNRLRKGWKLETDPTVLYALGRHKKRVLYEDLKIDSPYNTYMYAGLPPGPICSPGAASLRAAIYPEDVDYFYFVARQDGSGTHIFSRTNRDHVIAKEKVKRRRRNQN